MTSYPAPVGITISEATHEICNMVCINHGFGNRIYGLIDIHLSVNQGAMRGSVITAGELSGVEARRVHTRVCGE